jgi:Cys-tRNA(Pro)/Cys-tRNA(Cys) deacylase
MHDKVATVLQSAGTAYKLHRHDSFDRPIKRPADFADALGYPLERIVKAVFLRNHEGTRFAMGVCSTNRKLQLKEIASRLEVKRLEIAGKDELRRHTGYPIYGVSPLGLENIPVFMDEALKAYPTVLIGAGQAGVEIEISPVTVSDISGAAWLRLTQ